MSKFTPGPWEAVGSTVRTVRDTEGGGGIFVADCFRTWDRMEFAFDGSEADANARLIAAASDMYEALKAMFQANKDNDVDAMAKAMELGIEALAKADGKQEGGYAER